MRPEDLLEYVLFATQFELDWWEYASHALAGEVELWPRYFNA